MTEGTGKAKGFEVEASVRVTYRFVAEDEADAIGRARELFVEDVQELLSGAYHADAFRVVSVVKDQAAVRRFAEENGETEILLDIEGEA